MLFRCDILTAGISSLVSFMTLRLSGVAGGLWAPRGR